VRALKAFDEWEEMPAEMIDEISKVIQRWKDGRR